MLAVTCPRCRQTLSVNESLSGHSVTCPQCNADVDIPAEGESTPPAASASVGHEANPLATLPPPSRHSAISPERGRAYARHRQTMRTAGGIVNIVLIISMLIGIVTGALLLFNENVMGFGFIAASLLTCVPIRALIAAADLLADIHEMIQNRDL